MTLKLELLDDVCYIEVGRTISDFNYGNWRLSIRVPCRSGQIDTTLDEVKAFVESKLTEWKARNQGSYSD